MHLIEFYQTPDNHWVAHNTHHSLGSRAATRFEALRLLQELISRLERGDSTNENKGLSDEIVSEHSCFRLPPPGHHSFENF